MSCNRVFTDFMNDVDRYLASKFEGVPSHYIQEISAYIASRVGVLAYDLCNERDKEWAKSLQRRKPISKTATNAQDTPYVDEHEFNCAHILKVEEKPE